MQSVVSRRVPFDEAGRHRGQEREDGERLGVDRVITPTYDLTPLTLELTRRQDVGRKLGQKDEPRNQDQRVGHA